MEKSVQMGMNKTGVQMAPLLSKDMAEYAEKMPITGDLDADYKDIRRDYIQASEGLGTVPPPATIKGIAKMGAKKITGKKPELLLDKLSERLAFERTGTRLWDALLLKAEESPLDLPLDKIREIRDQEASHFHLLKDVITQLGGDPTVQTPCADSAAVASMGLIQVLGDARTDMPQSLNAILTAELTDNAAWELLIELSKKAGIEQFVSQFEEALEVEQEHLAFVKGLLSRLTVETVAN